MLLSVVLALIDEVGIWAIVRFTPSEDPFVANRMEGTCGYSANPEKLLQRAEALEKNWRSFRDDSACVSPEGNAPADEDVVAVPTAVNSAECQQTYDRGG